MKELYTVTSNGEILKEEIINESGHHWTAKDTNGNIRVYNKHLEAKFPTIEEAFINTIQSKLREVEAAVEKITKARILLQNLGDRFKLNNK